MANIPFRGLTVQFRSMLNARKAHLNSNFLAILEKCMMYLCKWCCSNWSFIKFSISVCHPTSCQIQLGIHYAQFPTEISQILIRFSTYSKTLLGYAICLLHAIIQNQLQVENNKSQPAAQDSSLQSYHPFIRYKKGFPDLMLQKSLIWSGCRDFSGSNHTCLIQFSMPINCYAYAYISSALFPNSSWKTCSINLNGQKLACQTQKVLLEVIIL